MTYICSVSVNSLGLYKGSIIHSKVAYMWVKLGYVRLGFLRERLQYSESELAQVKLEIS